MSSAGCATELLPVGPRLVPAEKINAIEPASTSPTVQPPRTNHRRLEGWALGTRTFAWQRGHSSCCPASDDGLSSQAWHFGHVYFTMSHSPRTRKSILMLSLLQSKGHSELACGSQCNVSQESPVHPENSIQLSNDGREGLAESVTRVSPGDRSRPGMPVGSRMWPDFGDSAGFVRRPTS